MSCLVMSCPVTGSAGRQWTSIDWIVSALDGSNCGDITRYLNSINSISEVITVPRNWFNATTYTVSLTVTNFFHRFYVLQDSFVVGGNKNIPSVNILGLTQLVVKASEIINIQAVGNVSSCSRST